MPMECNSSFECTPEAEKFLCERLLDPSQPIPERFRALFSLRNLKGQRPREALVRVKTNQEHEMKVVAFDNLHPVPDILEGVSEDRLG